VCGFGFLEMDFVAGLTGGHQSTLGDLKGVLEVV